MNEGINFVTRMFMMFVLIGVWQATGISAFAWLALLNFILMVFWGISALAQKDAQ